MIAIIALLLALQAAPELKQHVDAGLKAKSAGDLDTAIREFQRVVELAPAMAAAHVNLGAVYYEKRLQPRDSLLTQGAGAQSELAGRAWHAGRGVAGARLCIRIYSAFGGSQG